MRCIRCGSRNVAQVTKNDGYSITKGIAGQILFGAGGAIAGINGKKKTVYHCSACGIDEDALMPSVIEQFLNEAIEKNDVYRLRDYKKQYYNIEWNDTPSIQNMSSSMNNTYSIRQNHSTHHVVSRKQIHEEKKKAVSVASLANMIREYINSINAPVSDEDLYVKYEEHGKRKIVEAIIDLRSKGKIKEVAPHVFVLVRDFDEMQQLIEKEKELQRKKEAEKKEQQTKEKIREAQYLLGNVYGENELENVIKKIGNGQKIPEISELIKNARKNYEDSIPIAHALWKEYFSKRQVLDKIGTERDAIQKNREENQKRLSTLGEELERIIKIKKDFQLNGDVLQSESSMLQELERQLQQAKNDLDKLGLFALGAKKEANARILSLQSQIDKQKQTVSDVQKKQDALRSETESLRSENDIEQEICSIKSDISVSEQKSLDIDVEYKKAESLLGEIRNKIIMTPQYLAVLLSERDLEILKALSSDKIIEIVIKSNTQLSSILQQNLLYDALPLVVKSQYEQRNGKNDGLDLEAIYFQACQAMDHPTSNDDIIWAKNQFMNITGYKDVDMRISKCNSMIAGIE